MNFLDLDKLVKQNIKRKKNITRSVNQAKSKDIFRIEPQEMSSK